MPQYDTDIITNSISTNNQSFTISEVWIIISLLLAVIGGIILYNTYFSKEKDNKYNGYKKILNDYINFNITIIEPLFIVLYLILSIAITLISLTFITTNFFKFIGIIVFGNIILRLIFEFILLMLKLFKDVSEINKKTKTNTTKLKKKTTDK